LTVVVALALASSLAWSQKFTKGDRDHAQGMLRDAAEDVRKHYYDAKLHGVDWTAKVGQAKANIDKADSMDDAISEIAALLDSLDDPHTLFLPPPRAYDHDYGFNMQMVGNRCFITRVRAGSDAEKKGLNVGDEVAAVNQYVLSREAFRRTSYIYGTLKPQASLRLTLRADSGERQLDVKAKYEPSLKLRYGLLQGVNERYRDWVKRSDRLRARYFEKGDDFLAVRIPAFAFSALETDSIIGKMRKHKGVVLDLRGNPGGYSDTLARLLGGMFQNDLKICDRVGRDSTKSVSVTGRHNDAFVGRLAVLVDSGSSSASEIFARVVQLERRGFVLGDRSAGSVMEVGRYRHETYVDTNVFYATTVTEADLRMADGNSLEHLGVVPDIEILPAAGDLASGRDPAMAKAAGLVGTKISPEEAGTMFPYEDPQ